MDHVTRFHLKTDCDDRSELIDFCLNGDKQFLVIGWSNIYEKGKREGNLNFVLKVADYYDVSCDYLLGRTLDRDGFKISPESIPDAENSTDDKVFKGNVISTLNKKLIMNSLSVIFDLLQKCNDKVLLEKVSQFFMIAIYKIFRLIYSGNNKNPQDFFSVAEFKHKSLADSKEILIENKFNRSTCRCDECQEEKDKENRRLASLKYRKKLLRDKS